MNPPEKASRSGRRQLLLVASLFIVPFVAAIALYYSSDWRPIVNSQGTLIDPPRTLTASGLTLPDGRPASADVFEGHWSIVYFAAACDARTEALFEELGRVRTALDKDAPRVRRVLLHPGSCAGGVPPAGETDLLVLSATGPGSERLRAAFPPAVDGDPGLYLVDPHGNLMMSYPATGSARGLLNDLERLLRLSNIG
jgi:cytochrome oxidase Cu insertion factor (SCO1/SenC/PrrC family)